MSGVPSSSKSTTAGGSDLNGDQIDDLISVDTGNNSLKVQPGGPDLTSSDVASYSPGVASFAAHLADFNGDQQLDVLVADAAQRTLEIMLNDGAGAFGEPRVYPQSSLLPPQRCCRVGPRCRWGPREHEERLRSYRFPD